MLKKTLFFSVLFLMLFNSSCSQETTLKSASTSAITFASLSCNAQANPTAIDHQAPLLSWIVKADGFNRTQTAYQVLVASNPKHLTEKEADMWNSQQVKSTQSIHHQYQGKPLLPTQKYWWKVRIWDEQNKVSSWSPVQTFEMGLMKASNWRAAQWISLKKDTRSSEHRFREYKTGKMEDPVMLTSQAAGYFRKEITAEKEIAKARAYICGLGYYELYMNGQKVGDHVLDPAPSNYDKQAYYVSYDVSEQIKSGKNAVGIMLGNGFYGQNISWKNDPESEKDLSYGIPAVRLLIKLTYTDGSQKDFYTDENWKEATGPIVFDNIYGGDTYDARFEINGWNELGYDDSTWGQVNTISPDVKKITAQQIPPIRELKELPPQRVFKSSKGKWVVDFGQNIAGWVQIKVKEKEGQLIEMIPTEALTQKGDDIYPGSTGGGANGMKQLLQYICKGSGTETWHPKFSYHGFRYVEISGISTRPDKNSIKAILVANDVEQQGSFSCSDELLNKMDTISRWTIVDNLHGIPEDCPHREKCGWLGDAHAFCEYALYNYDIATFYKKYMEDIRTQMRLVKGKNNPAMTFKVPTMIAPGKRTSTIAKLDWGIATIYLPWYNYLYYGDKSIVTDYYEEMKGLTNYYLSFKNSQGIIDNGMGDWCPPRWDRRKNPSAMECDPVVSANAYFYDILGIMEHFAAMNKDDDFAAKMRQEKTQSYKAFNAAFLIDIPTTEHQWYGSQTATVMALQFDMVPEANLERVLNGLIYDINIVKDGHHSRGIHGNRYIYTVLSKYGKVDLAHDLLTVPTFPSQTYVMNYGFTTWPERQFEWAKMEGLTNSLNHPMHSGFAAYFYESLGGIKSTFQHPGYKEFTVKPIFPKQITQTTVKIPTPYGYIHSSSKKDAEAFTINLQVPFNTQAKLILTPKEQETLSINGLTWAQFQKANRTPVNKTSTVVLGSGTYMVEYLTSGN